MKRIDPAQLDAYLRADPVAKLAADAQVRPPLTSQRWLDQTPAKRFIYHELYGDCLAGAGPCSLLDVGGGMTALTPLIAAGRRYGLIDPLFHEAESSVAAIRGAMDTFNHFGADWQETETGSWDVIVANDLFPNVDQRLALFVDWAVKRARDVRLSLTFHNKPRWYTLQRAGLDERLTMLAFDGARTRAALEPFSARIAGWNAALFDGNDGSVFPNGRQVILLNVQGDL